MGSARSLYTRLVIAKSIFVTVFTIKRPKGASEEVYLRRPKMYHYIISMHVHLSAIPTSIFCIFIWTLELSFILSLSFLELIQTKIHLFVILEKTIPHFCLENDLNPLITHYVISI